MPHLASVVPNPVGAYGRFSLAAMSSKPPMPTVVSITNRPTLRTVRCLSPLQRVIDDAVELGEIAEEVVHPPAQPCRHDAPIAVRNR